MDFKKVMRLILTGDLSDVAIGDVCNIHRTTVAKYRRQNRDHPINLDQIDNLSVDALRDILNLKRQLPPRQWSEPDWDLMAQRMSSQKGMVMTVLHDDYAREAETPMSYTRFCRELRKHLKKRGPVMRQIRFAGEEVFVDFSGKRPQVVNPETGKPRPVELFIGALGHSRLIFALAVPDQSTQSWIKAVITMFEYFDGVPKFIVPDNLKAAVIKTRSKSSGQMLNAAFDRAMQHYGVTTLPARVRTPQDKALVEQSVLHVKRWITLRLARQVFHSLAELNRAISLELDLINEKPMRRMGGRSRRQIFEEEEHARLRPLPHRPFRNLQHIKSARVPEDYHIEHNGNFYSVPHELIGQRIDLFEDQEVISLFHERRRLAVHPRQAGSGKTSTLRHHQPENHRYHGDHRRRYFYTWGRYQAIPIDRYLRLHLEVWKNPNATDKCAHKLSKLLDSYGEDIVIRAADWILTHFSDAPHITRLERLIMQPGLMDVAGQEQDESEEVLEHKNIRGARYYGGDNA